jgi:hypothetical protein
MTSMIKLHGKSMGFDSTCCLEVERRRILGSINDGVVCARTRQDFRESRSQDV